MSSRLKPAPPGVQLKFSQRNKWIEVTLLRVNDGMQQRGHGTLVMKRLQAKGRPIRLTAIPNPRKKTALHRFYRRLGFRPIGRDSVGNTEFEWLPQIANPKSQIVNQL